MEDARVWFEQGRAALPRWDAPRGHARDERIRRAVGYLERAFAFGFVEAGRLIASVLQDLDLRASFDWAVRLARLADEDRLATVLRQPDLPPDLAALTRAWARAGEPWAETALGIVCVHAAAGGHPPHPSLDLVPRHLAAQADAWFERAAARDWPSAAWWLASRIGGTDPGRALALARLAATHPSAGKDLRRLAQKLAVGLLAAHPERAPEMVQILSDLAADGDGEALVQLGDRARDAGRPDEARALYQRAADDGDARARRRLSELSARAHCTVAEKA